MSDPQDSEPSLVEVISVPSLSEAERIAKKMRDMGIPAILDPAALQALQERGYKDVHGYFPVVVPRTYEKQAEEHLYGTVHLAQGDAEMDAILASFDEEELDTGPPVGRRLIRMAVLAAIVALLAVLALSGVF